MLPSEIANPNIKLLYLWGLEAQAKPQVHTTQVYEALAHGLVNPKDLLCCGIKVI